MSPILIAITKHINKMARNLTLVRTEAEWLIELLESCDPEEVGSWRHDMADDIRKLFGMVSREIEQEKTHK